MKPPKWGHVVAEACTQETGWGSLSREALRTAKGRTQALCLSSQGPEHTWKEDSSVLSCFFPWNKHGTMGESGEKHWVNLSQHGVWTLHVTGTSGHGVPAASFISYLCVCVCVCVCVYTCACMCMHVCAWCMDTWGCLRPQAGRGSSPLREAYMLGYTNRTDPVLLVSAQ
jgi:hypothetical protein